MATSALDRTISDFFASRTTASRPQCDAFVLARTGLEPDPLPVQGTSSYTVSAGPAKIFQFRALASNLDADLATLAAEIHAPFVAGCREHGTLGEDEWWMVRVYEMDLLRGTPYRHMERDGEGRPPPGEGAACKRRMVEGLAEFFAQSFNRPQALGSEKRAALLAEFENGLGRLAESLPARFSPLLDKVRGNLPLVFSGVGLPFVLTHGDLCGTNLLVDPSSGDLTGVVDWAEARILPFGFALYGLENVLGFMDGEEWHYVENARELKGVFWRAFLEGVSGEVGKEVVEGIWAARMAGLFWRYGFVQEGAGEEVVEGEEGRRVVEEGSEGMRCLDVLGQLGGWVPEGWEGDGEVGESV